MQFGRASWREICIASDIFPRRWPLTNRGRKAAGLMGQTSASPLYEFERPKVMQVDDSEDLFCFVDYHYARDFALFHLIEGFAG